MKITARTVLLSALLVVSPLTTQAATVGGDGGVTIWLSFDNSATGPIDIDDPVNVIDSTGAASCAPTDAGRAAVSEVASPGMKLLKVPRTLDVFM